jgi:uncharacterized integral membrane protein (TIGR00697 family)
MGTIFQLTSKLKAFTTQQVKNQEESYRLVAIDDSYEDKGRVFANVQVVGTSRVFTASIQDLYKRETLDKFCKEDVAYIGFLYAAESENNLDLIPHFPRKTITQNNHIVLIGVLYSSFLILSNIIGGKITTCFGYHIPAVLFMFPLTYIFDDILTEVYGFKVSRRIIWYGLFANLIIVLGSTIALSLPASPYWSDQTAYETVFRSSPRILIASTLGYLIGEFLNSIILAKLKILTSGKYLWLRTIGSASVSTIIDSSIYCLVAFYAILPIEVILQMIMIQYIFKISYEVLALPLTYRICNYLKTADAVDVYDYHTNFNPFSLRI